MCKVVDEARSRARTAAGVAYYAIATTAARLVEKALRAAARSAE